MYQKGFAPVLIVILIAIVMAVGGAFYLGKLSSKSTSVVQQPVYQIPQYSSTPTQANKRTLAPSPTSDPTVNWQSLLLDKLNFKIPTSWVYEAWAPEQNEQ